MAEIEVGRPSSGLGETGSGAMHERPLQVVPVRGIPIAAAALVALVIAVASRRLWALEFFHVAAGGLWTAIDLFVGFIVGPTIARLPIPGRVAFAKRFMPKMVLLMPTLVVITLTAGWELANQLGRLGSDYLYHGWLVASYVVVGVLALVAIGLLEPANLAVLFELRKAQPDGALVGRLMRRFIYAAGVTGLGQVAILIIMTKVGVA